MELDISQNKVIFKLCPATVGTSGGNTTNLLKHLKTKPPEEHAESVSLRPVRPHHPMPSR